MLEILGESLRNLISFLKEETTFFHELGPKLLQFYSVLNRFYLDSAKGNFHPWLAEYLDAGKPQELIDFGRMKRMRQTTARHHKT